MTGILDFIAYLIALLKLGWPIIVLAILSGLFICYPLANVYTKLSVWWVHRENERIKRLLRK